MSRSIFVVLVAALLTAGRVSAADPDSAIGRIQLPCAVKADGKVLPAGSYQVRLTDLVAKPAVGQSNDAERWIEFVSGGQVVAREVSTVVSDADARDIVKSPHPGANHTRVDTLKGGDYVRIWINRDGTNYLINMPVSAPSHTQTVFH